MKSVKRNLVINIFRKAKISFMKIYYARGSAHEIALGAAIGAFWGVFPTFGLSTILSLLLYKIFRFFGSSGEFLYHRKTLQYRHQSLCTHRR